MPPKEPAIQTEPEKVEVIEIRTPQTIVQETAQRYGVFYFDMFFIVEHEGGWKQEPCVQAEHIYPDGTRENSWGGFQINLDHNPAITKEQACDWQWSADWSARQLLEGKFYLWTSIKAP